MSADLAGRLRSWTVANRDRIVSDLEMLAAVDSPSGEIDLLDETAALLEHRVQRMGATVKRTPTDAGTHLELRFGPESGRPLLLLGHYDTVWPRGTATARPLAIKDGIARGPGVFDMRGGIVAALNAVAGLQAAGALTRPVTMLLTADEETGSTTSESLIVQLGTAAEAVLVPEPPMGDGGLKTQRKGVLTYRVAFHGRASHAGLDPERGVSAIHELLTVGQLMRELARPEHGTTINVGVIAGGSRSNVVAAEAVAEVDVRVMTMDEYARIDAWFEAIDPQFEGAAITVERLHVRPPMERTPAVAKAAERAKVVARLLGIDLTEGSAGGGSDANFLACRGVAVVDGLGPVGGGAHALDEHISIDSLIQRAALLALLVAEL